MGLYQTIVMETVKEKIDRENTICYEYNLPYENIIRN